MYIIVRVDGPQTINREATSTPRPVWEDENGDTLTLKKVWADANGKEIDDDEYQARQRRMKEREEGSAMTPTPEVAKSGCCGSKKPRVEPDSHMNESPGGCRHRQNVTIPQAQGEKTTADSVAATAQKSADVSNDSWVAACSCGSSCSCLYCPDHPNNETSIKHTQQQVKNLAEQAYASEGPMPSSFIPEDSTRSCMGGRPSFFLSRTPGVSRQQLQQFFSDNLDPDAIYLTYPIQQHSWTNQPVSTHCSHSQSPAGVLPTPSDPADTYFESTDDISTLSTPWDMTPNEATGTWDFSDGQLGDTSFSWIDLDASRGTDYSIGQASVASMANRSNSMMLFTPQDQQISTTHLPRHSGMDLSNLDTLKSMAPGGFGDSCCQFGLQSDYVDFDVTTTADPSVQFVQPQAPLISPDFSHQNTYGEQTSNGLSEMAVQPLLAPRPQALHTVGFEQQLATLPINNIDANLALWNSHGPLVDDRIKSDFMGIPVPNSPPIANGV